MGTAHLILANGTVFTGSSFGATGVTIGETVFTTAMVGYIETLTDPSYYGQLVTQTFPLIGNYGVIPEDYESKKIHYKGYIVRELCETPSNFRCQGKLNDWLKSSNVIGIYGIDTRQLTKILREAGVMNGMLVSGDSEEAKAVYSALSNPSEKEKLLEKIRSFTIKDAVPGVTASEITESAAAGSTQNSAEKKVVLWDFGAKENIARELEKRGCHLIRVPAQTTAEKILSYNPDGIMLSNGPGDPAENTEIIKQLKLLTESRKPIFGICLGHQLLSLARGAKTLKLKYGHRGGNHPVKDLATGRVYITSQNHGYAVDTENLPEGGKLSFVNVNDNTVEGITYTDIPAFSVQFHPEACGGPKDTNFLFDRFMEMINNASE